MPQSLLTAFVRRIPIPRAGPALDLPTNVGQIRVEMLAGLTVALALVPEAVAFSFVAGVHPLVGLYAAFMVGLVTALLGGRPGMISGATGALAVVMVSLVSAHGVEYLFATVVLMGLIQIAAGALQLGKFIRLVPHPVMLGFVNGLAIVIFMAQLSQFQVPGTAGAGGGHGMGSGEWLSGMPLYLMLGLTGLTMLIIWGLPKFTTAIPAPLASIVLVAVLVIVLGLDVPRVGDLASIKGELPSFHLPSVPISWSTVEIILPYAVILAAIGLIESLLTLNLVGEMTGRRSGASQECVAQGAANVVTGLFGGMGGCAMIGQSMINVKSGGRTRLSALTAAIMLLAFILFASGLIEQIPLAALVGVMFMVVIGTFVWRSVMILRKIPLTDALVMLMVTGVTVFYNLATAVIVGVIVSALAFAWNHAKRIRASTEILDSGEKIYRIDGPLFFASTDGFRDIFTPESDPDRVVIDFIDSQVVDQSALQAIEDLAKKYAGLGKTVQLRHLSRDCHKLLKRAGQLMVDADDDPDYGLAVNYNVRTEAFNLSH
ncbi:MAG: SulP family inorganic anion transporter [Parvularcula sp.]